MNDKELVQFRAQCGWNKKWVYGDLIHRYNYKGDSESDYTVKHILVVGKGEFSVMPETVGQYSGVNDRKDVKIFRHDLVNILCDGKIYMKNQNREIIVHQGAFGFIDNAKRFVPLCSLDEYTLEIEIAGNIFNENKRKNESENII